MKASPPKNTIAGLGQRQTRIPFVRLTMLWLGFLSLVNAEVYTPGQYIDKDFASFARPFLESHCLDCHSGEDPEGNLSLEDIGPLDVVNAATWKSIWSQVALKEMPPADSQQPEIADRLRFSSWIVGQLTDFMHDKGGFHDHLDPNKGNFLDHDLLFDSLPEGIELQPTSSPARIWRVSRMEHVTRLNELINTEPAYDPARPGLRTHGDFVPTNHGGELKLYFGVDRIIKWQGGTVAYATSVKSVPAILASTRKHGLENYHHFYTVNSAEATQIISLAGDLIRYMADGPLSIAQPYQITDDPKSIEDKMQGDLRGLPTALVYSTKIVRPLTPIYELMQEESPTEQHLRAAVNYLFEALTFRPPRSQESNEYLEIVKQSINKLGKQEGAVLGLSAIFLDRDALFRPELVKEGEADQYGRVMLQDWELGLAVNHALRFIQPDQKLRNAITEGRMRTKADVKREIARMLADDSIRKPRILRFFREYFDYDLAGYICKDSKALGETGASARGQGHYKAMFAATASTDRLVELILAEDSDVLKQLLTTDKVVATNADNVYFGRKRTKKERQASVAEGKKANVKLTRNEAAKIREAEEQVVELQRRLDSEPEGKVSPKIQRELKAKKKAVVVLKRRTEQAKKRRARINHSVDEATLSGPKLFARVSHRSFGNGSMKPERFLATAPKGERMGILTHPSWLVSHSDAMDNHAIHRGRWIRERLLGKGIPDVPITVDAMLPDEPKSTLRGRMQVTREDYCWTCHKKMDPLGLPFEMYNHAGLYRTTEHNNPVDTTGQIIDSGDPALDGKVSNPIEMIQKLAESERVEQVFVRHAFRFWMGRNETLNDALVLQEAHHAYRANGGSMQAMLTSLLTSDAFLYRTRN